MPLLVGSGTPSPGQAITLQVSNGLPSGVGVLFLSATSDSTGRIPCMVVGFPAFYIPFNLDGAGSKSLTATIPTDDPADFHMYLQFYGVDLALLP